MSIKVEVQKVTPRHNDLPDEIKVNMLNEMAEDFAREVVQAIGDLTCEKHPSRPSRIIIIADRNHTMIVRKRCCCPEFETVVSRRIARD